MGFSFQTEEQRNPTLSHEQLQVVKEQDAQKQKEMICADIQAKLTEIEEFIDENRLLQKFYAWQELKEQMRDTGAVVIEDDKLLDQ